jgi:hypothetical protein
MKMFSLLLHKTLIQTIRYLLSKGSTQSKDFSKLQKIPPTMSLLFKAFSISLGILKEAISVDNLV